MIGGGDNEAGVSRAAQELIEFAQLAALSFPANPGAFGLAPLTAPMKVVEAFWLAAVVTVIEGRDPVQRRLYDLLVVGRCFARRIGKVSKDREVHVARPDYRGK